MVLKIDHLEHRDWGILLSVGMWTVLFNWHCGEKAPFLFLYLFLLVSRDICGGGEIKLKMR